MSLAADEVLAGIALSVERLQKELAELRKQAAAAKQEAENKKAAGGPPADSEGLKRTVDVGFSAAGLLAAGQGSRDATVTEIKAVRRELVEANKALAKIRDKRDVARAG